MSSYESISTDDGESDRPEKEEGLLNVDRIGGNPTTEDYAECEDIQGVEQDFAEVIDYASDGSEDSDDSASAGVDESPLNPVAEVVRLVPSLFEGGGHTVFFDYPATLGLKPRPGVSVTEPLGGRELLFKTHWERNSVKNAFYRAGFTRTKGNSWSANWGKHPTVEGYRALTPTQKVNHLPGSWCIGRKDSLMRTIDKMRMTHPQEFDFLPRGYILPKDRRAWLWTFETEPDAIWILKPPASSCGRGIRLVTRNSSAAVSSASRKPGKRCLMQRYIENPLLIGDRKFDLRLYVLVTSMDPLRIYIYDEGLARLSTKKYSMKNLKNKFAHLTNYSINKKAPNYNCAESADPSVPDLLANKWALSVFWKYLDQQFGAQQASTVRRPIDDLIVKTLMAADGSMAARSSQLLRHRESCFELFGFDVMLDSNLKPWLLEVNISPSLLGGSALDCRIKGALMADTFHLVGFVPSQTTSNAESETSSVSSARTSPQPAWRAYPSIQSVDLSVLDACGWSAIRTFEDEQSRAKTGGYRTLYPVPSAVRRLSRLIPCSMWLNDVLGRWVIGGGLGIRANRASPGLKLVQEVSETIEKVPPASQPLTSSRPSSGTHSASSLTSSLTSATANMSTLSVSAGSATSLARRRRLISSASRTAYTRSASLGNEHSTDVHTCTHTHTHVEDKDIHSSVGSGSRSPMTSTSGNFTEDTHSSTRSQSANRAFDYEKKSSLIGINTSNTYTDSTLSRENKSTHACEDNIIWTHPRVHKSIPVHVNRRRHIPPRKAPRKKPTITISTMTTADILNTVNERISHTSSLNSPAPSSQSPISFVAPGGSNVTSFAEIENTQIFSHDTCKVGHEVHSVNMNISNRDALPIENTCKNSSTIDIANNRLEGRVSSEVHSFNINISNTVDNNAILNSGTSSEVHNVNIDASNKETLAQQGGMALNRRSRRRASSGSNT